MAGMKATHRIPGATPAAAAWFSHLPGPALIVGDDGAVLYANQPVAGLGAEELLGVDVANLVPPEHRDGVRAAIADAFHPGIAHVLEFPFLSGAGGTPVWHHATLSPLEVPGLRAALLLASDVDAQHREGERLRRSERLMVDSEGTAHLGTWVWDITQPTAVWSEELYRIYGLDPRTHVPTYQDYLTRVHPEDVGRVKAATEAVFQKLQPYSHDERIRRPDGSWRDLHTWAQPLLDPQGKLVALLGVCQDITDRKEAERALHASQERFRAIFERSALGMAILDAAGKVLDANAALVAMAAAPAPALVGHPLAGLVHPDERPAVEAHFRAAAAAPSAPAPRQLKARLQRGDGSTLPASIHLVPIPAAGARDAFHVAILEDVSALERAVAADQVAFARLQEIRQLEESGERRTRLLHVASHELKNPLTPIVFQLHMLGRGTFGPLNERQARAVAMANKQVSRISHLLRDVLDVTRIEQGGLAMRPAPLDLAALARRVAEDYRGVAAEWGITLEAADTGPAWVEADPERIEQVLVNLVGNALKFTPKDGKVTVRCALAGPQARVEVADTGPGLAAEQKARLFRAFSQVHQPGQAREEGTGLGLFISKSIVEQSGGRLAVASEPGQGATFSFSLPAAPAAGAKGAPPKPAPVKRPTAAA
jgi:PAS domain S-box-containing protein